jgi:hypothetical protein
MRLRFSIRWLLAATTVVAILCGITVGPTILARQLVEEVNAGDFTELEFLKLQRPLWIFRDATGYQYPLKALRIEAILVDQSWRDLFQCRRRVSVNRWPPKGAPDNLPASDSSYVFVRNSGATLGGEEWE